MKTVIFDLDGVIANYDRDAYKGENPAYLNSGYFENIQPDSRAVNALRTLNERSDKLNCRVLVKSTLSSNDGNVALMQAHEKHVWLQKNCGFLDVDKQLILLPFPEQTVEIDDSYTLKQTGTSLLLDRLFESQYDRLTSVNILIDDYNKNLTEWTKLGGLGIKYNNGLNSPNKNEPEMTFHGLHLTRDMTSRDIADFIQYLLTTVETKG